MNMKIENWLGNEIRFVEINGEWWAVGNDVTRALGYKDYKKILSRLNDKYKGVDKLSTPGGIQRVTIVNELGVYELIIKSNKWKYCVTLMKNHIKLIT